MRKTVGTENELIAVIVRNNGERAFGRTEHFNICEEGFSGKAAGDSGTLCGGFAGIAVRFRAKHDAAQARRRRKFELPARFELAFQKAGDIARRRHANDEAFGLSRLNKDKSVGAMAPRPPRNLHDQRENPFRRAEIGHRKPLVSHQDADHAHAGKIEAFGDHLRADEKVDFAAPECAERIFELALCARRIGIEASVAYVREMLTQFFLDALPYRSSPRRGRASRIQDTRPAWIRCNRSNDRRGGHSSCDR